MSPPPPQTSLRDLLAYAASLFSRLVPHARYAAVEPYVPLSGAPTCPLDGPVSCHNSTPVADADACCFVYPGGRLLLTQFWDETAYRDGGEQDWTLHGLWPDHCDGRFDVYCDMTPRFYNVTEILQHYGQGELLAQMDRYWIAHQGPNSHLWSHEYNKHASCVNTLARACYGAAYRPGIEVVDYLARAFQLFRTLDTYRGLAAAGIEPSRDRTYPLAELRRALDRFSGGRVVLRCRGPGLDILHEAWYSYFVRGSLQSGEFVPARVAGSDGDVEQMGNCAGEVRYLPKTCRGPGCGRAGEL